VRLPGNAVGITDINQYRACPRRFEFGMQRHTPAGEHPQAQSSSTAYGSAIHEAIAYIEAREATDEQAAQRAFDLYAKWMEPADLGRLTQDLATYRQRDFTGVRTVAVEQELRMPLFEYQGETIYFRGKIDRLYERLDAPGVFVQIDYKSSRHPRSDADVQADTQQWAYNLLVHEVYPECAELVQLYDQLLFGVIPTRKTAEQREQMRAWLIHQITAILNDDALEPTINDFCAWCPILHDCPVVQRATDYAKARILVLGGAPRAAEFRVYSDQLDDVGQAIKVLKKFETDVKTTIGELPEAERAQLGYRGDYRKTSGFSPNALRTIHELMGDDFYTAVGLTKTKVAGHPREQEVLALSEERRGPLVLRKEKTA
jgi:hypothetical protein